MVTIKVGPIYTNLSGNYPEKKLRKVLSYRPHGYQFSDKFQCKVWDGYIYFLTPKGRLPAGLTSRVIRVLKAEKIKFKIVRSYTNIEFADIDQILIDFGLRDYQFESLQQVHKFKRGVIDLPPGGGKTRTAAAIIQMFKVPPTLFIVPTLDLLYQTQKVLEELLGEEIGIIGDGKDIRCRVDVASIKTIKNVKKYKKYLETKQLLIVDEAHHLVADTWYQVAMATPAIYRIGLTGTPDVHAKLLIEACLGPILISVPPARLIADGYLSEPLIKMVKIDEPINLQETNYYNAYRDGIENNDYRNLIIAKLAKFAIESGDYPVVVLVKRIDHGTAVLKHLKRMKIKSVFASGENDSAERHIVIRRLSFREKFVAVASDVFTEGIDAPGLRCVIMAGGGKSYKDVLQRLGRGMRINGTKKSVVVYDFVDAINRYLLKHSKKRVALYKQKGYSIEMFDLLKLGEGGDKGAETKKKVYATKKKLKRFRKDVGSEVLYRD